MILNFIGKNTPSSKNARRWVGKRLIKNKLSLDYEKWLLPQLIEKKAAWDEATKNLEFPYEIEFFFYRDSKRKFDYINVLQIIADLLQKAEYLKDDDAYHFIPIFKGFEVTTKEKAGFSMEI